MELVEGQILILHKVVPFSKSSSIELNGFLLLLRSKAQLIVNKHQNLATLLLHEYREITA